MMLRVGVGLLLLLLVACAPENTVLVTYTPTPAETVTLTATATVTPTPTVTNTPETICVLSTEIWGYTELYDSPSLTNKLDPSVVLTQGEEVQILQTDTTYAVIAYEIRTADGQTGWVPFFVLPVLCRTNA